jgi:hypothetical protein
LSSQRAQHFAKQQDELVAIHALCKLSQPRAREQLIDRRDEPQLLGLLGGDSGFPRRDPEGAMFARFAGVHGCISAQGSGLPQWKLRWAAPVLNSHETTRVPLTGGRGASSMVVRGCSGVAVSTTTTTTIDEELNQFERDIRQLKIEYEQFFGGGRKRPPTEIEWRLELLTKRYAERSGELKYGQRFRYNNLTQTYAKYKDVFRKRLQQKEEGHVSRHFGSAAKKIEAERAEKRAATRSKAEAAAEAKRGTAEKELFRVVCSKPEEETDKITKLYEAFLEAKQKAGEDTIKFTRSNFHEFVTKKTKDLQKTKHCKDVEYVVEVTEGHVKLKALVKT